MQKLPSEHAAPFGFVGLSHMPVAGLHVPRLWHWSGAGQTTGLVPVQTPAMQLSVCVHLSPSSHATPSPLGKLGEQTPVIGMHVPAVWH